MVNLMNVAGVKSRFDQLENISILASFAALQVHLFCDNDLESPSLKDFLSKFLDKVSFEKLSKLLITD